MSWNPRDLPSQAGRTIVVTGGARGVGYFAAEQLAAAGARVVIAARSRQRADAASAAIRVRWPRADLGFVHLDLGSFASIREAADELSAHAIDVLINNAGLTSGPGTRAVTTDGLERVVGTNHFGPFALTALVFPTLSPAARVVGLGSLSTRLARANLADMQHEKGKYSFSRAYAMSKHGVHSFALELDRRLRAADSGVSSLLAHPGFALNGLSSKRPGITDHSWVELLMRPMAQGKDHGAWPIVRAAVDPEAEGGQFYGPRWLVKGAPALATPVSQSASPDFGAELWRLSEEATGIHFDVTKR